MGTAEILIVFSALMALIALVTIGIDWIGKPLKHRRFIPRIYRFDDEKLPLDAYGHAQLTDPSEQPLATMPGVAQAQHVGVYGPPPVAVAPQQRGANPTVRVPTAPTSQPAPTPEPAAAQSVAPAPSSSAFSDNLSPVEQRSTIAGTGEAAPTADRQWRAGKPLDTTVEGRKPSLAIKAERYWITTSTSTVDTHFEDDNIARMASGKAPRRMNPRTGRVEAMQLTGLRQASTTEQVRMRWPDDAADPWAAT